MNAAHRTYTARRYAPQSETPTAPASSRLIGITALMPSVAHQSYQRGSFEHIHFDLPALLGAAGRLRSSAHASPCLVRIVESPETSVPPQKTKIMLAACDDIFFLMWM